MAVDMVIKNGTVVVPNSTLRAHVIIDEGKVKEVTPFDDLPEAAFYMVGTIEDAVEKAKKMAAEAA